MKKMLNICIMSALLGMLLLPVMAQAATDVNTEAKILQSVSFRNQPSTSGTFLRYLKAGEIVVVLDKVNAYWYSIKDAQGKLGYVSTSDKYITIVSNAEIVSGVNFRPQPTTDSIRIRMLQTGEKMLVLEKVNEFWYRAQDLNGVEGYVSTNASYIVTDFSVTGVIITLSREEQIEQVIDAGMKYLGTPYEFGSSRYDTTTFDCSDFVRQAYLDGINFLLPSDSRAQGDFVKRLDTDVTSISQLKRGDLMFFMSYAGSRASSYDTLDKSAQTITHVGMYLGNGQVLHTFSVASGGVQVTNILGTTWEYRFLFGGSVLN